jgi:hypothetical protein
MTRHSRVSQASIIRATTATGMACTMAMINASNSSVKPMSSRAHGTVTCLIPQRLQVTRGTRACR